MELVTAYQLSQVLQISPRGVRKRLDEAKVERDRDTQGLVAWDRRRLPDDWQTRLDLLCEIKGAASISEVLTCQRHAAKNFEFSIEHATDHEKKVWPIRKAAVLEYYRALDAGCARSVCERRARELFEREASMPVNARTVRRWLKPVEKCGGPQHAPDEAYVLWGKRRTLPGPPRETVEYFNKLVTENQRKFSPAWRKLVSQLRAWRETGRAEFRIPGYSEPPPNAPGGDLPLRWSYHYFIDRKRRPAPIVIAGARDGTIAMRELAAIVRSTRVGVKVGEIIQFDDQVYDLKVNVLGINTRATRPLGLDAIDLASACTFASVFKPVVYDDEKKAKEMLKLRDMIWFVVHMLVNVGWREDTGSTWFVEHGTAAIPKWLQTNIGIVTGGKVKIRTGGVGGEAPFEGVFDGASKGNPRHKALLEGSRNRLRNDMADALTFPGAVGHDRSEPGDITGRDRYNALYLKAWSKMNERDRQDIAEQLVGPYLDWRLFPTLANACIHAINSDPEHNCEGWEKCGYTAQEFRWDDNSSWLPMRSLLAIEDAAKRNGALAFLESSPGLTRTRKLSRWEVWSKEAPTLTRLPLYLIPQLLTHQDAPDLSTLRTVTDSGEFLFHDKEADPYGGQFVFRARTIDRAGHEVRLTPGLKYKTFLNPLAPSTLIVAEQNGAYLGACPAVDLPAANDIKATSALVGEHKRLLDEGKTDLARLGAERTRELTRMKMVNEGIASPEKTDRKLQQEAAEHALANLYA